MNMSAQGWILLLLLGGIVGTAGQGIRVIVGLKKTYDQSVRESKPFSEKFSGSSLLFSLLIGFVAGVLGILSFSLAGADKIERQQIITLLGIGYAGCDFIEGFIKKYTPQYGGNTAAETVSAASPETTNQPAMG